MAEDDVTEYMPADTPLPPPFPVEKPGEKPAGPAGRIIGGYEVRGVLGRGGMGVVYRAWQAALNREVALKMLTGHYGRDELQRFLAEAQTAAALHHANIVHIYEVGEIDDGPFFSMEFIEGGTLAHKLRAGLPTVRETAELLMTVARALHFAHQHGVVHRDMKPGNILIDPDGAPKVVDFGIAKRLNDDTELTRTGAVIGTPLYMAPEQARGASREVGPASDVYSLGAIMFEMLTGRPPFLPADSDTAITIRVLNEETPSPARHRPQTPRELVVICVKCLQKEPRDRYPSAAAFAEDLRRFLDDEPIIASPPSQIMRTIRWVRRHPWQFGLRLGVLAILVLGSERLWQWEFHQRPHIEYSDAIDHKFNDLAPLGAVSAAEEAHRGITLRLTRRGRWGPIVRVELINSRGHPGIVRELFGGEPLPNFIEGVLGARDVVQEKRETTALDCLYEGEALTQVTGSDSNGIVNWRILYDRPATAHQRQAHGRIVTYRDFDFASRGGASVIELERDANGRDIKAAFFSGSGEPAANSEGVFGYQFERDAAGRVSRVVNLDKDGKPAPNRVGQVSVAFQRNARDFVTRLEFRDGAGQPAPWQGFAARTLDYDAAGNIVKITGLDADGRPTKGKSGNWAVEEIIRNEHGDAVEMRDLADGPAGQLSLLGKKVITYDHRGYPVDVRYEGRTRWRTALQHDDRGNIIEEKFLDPDGHPVAGADGWAIHRYAYQFSADGTREEETWFDAHGAPAFSKSGVHRRISEFDAAGYLRVFITEDLDPKRFRYQRYVSEPKFDNQGRLRHAHVRFQDAHGQPVINPIAGYEESEDDFDEKGHKTTSWQFGWDEKTWGASIWREDIEWGSTGLMRRRVEQAYDASRNRLDKISNTDPARTEEEFDAIGKLQRKLETGFDEARVGFYSRELRFAGGSFESAVFRNADGSEVNTIRALVKAILAQGQPQTKELRVGDQLLNANGEPVKNAFEWMLGRNFAGGFIEVLRDGKVIRIDGFQPGKLGILLEDRGPGAP